MKMIFKKDKVTGEIVAFFPYEFATWQGDFMCYAHNGQHGCADYRYYLDCKKATKDEYKDLYNELKFIGYDIEIIQKINGQKFRTAYNDFMAKRKAI